MTTLVPEPATTTNGHGDDLSHGVCDCDEDTALCGTDVTGVPWATKDDESDNLCIVCVDLVELPCPRCGQ
ncbi:hypothetical protein SCAB_60771 [Streptomyces scabiei 87.22]|uniref:Uncharacterized protein n=1 Tax=Streptomyces scabiei (strain 87.22) TaxID=680198 RepID=C9Z907_STRSW|nr:MULTISPECIES: hypothetical protein [Streptomyces]MBP5875696.1 hypothetical protein [Streptomyces sp. LBUM 1477]MDX2652153.1 hypothetical protein [Streptomyces scabiei]MDX2725821.1 hypothetical protein [Streptomyces scabiei]MDX2863940.1 hypothetical protein [Streptomyces scabiei]MDX2881864.1 hypothetical protein [Streptomyces scabiei]